jgi:hypothetical protein
MGRFAFDTTQATTNFLPHGRSRLTYLAYAYYRGIDIHHSLLSEEEIREKGEVNGLGEIPVCLQAICQCIVRLAQKQAIGFLELNIHFRPRYLRTSCLRIVVA